MQSGSHNIIIRLSQTQQHLEEKEEEEKEEEEEEEKEGEGKEEMEVGRSKLPELKLTSGSTNWVMSSCEQR